jgi:hypothetical protein
MYSLRVLHKALCFTAIEVPGESVSADVLTDLYGGALFGCVLVFNLIYPYGCVRLHFLSEIVK